MAISGEDDDLESEDAYKGEKLDRKVRRGVEEARERRDSRSARTRECRGSRSSQFGIRTRYQSGRLVFPKER